MEKTNQKLQDRFLEQLSLDNCDVLIYLKNGIKLAGKILEYDDTNILMTKKVHVSNQREDSQLIYKSAIASIVPGDRP